MSAWALVTDYREFDALRAEWEQLFACNPGHSPFLAWGWVSAWLHHLAGQPDLRIMVLRDSNEAVQLIVPLVRKSGGPFGDRLVLACSEGPDCSDYLGCLCHPSLNSELGGLVATGVENLLDANLRLTLAALDGALGFPGEMRSAMTQSGRRVRTTEDQACPRASLATDWDEYLLGLSTNFRSQVRRFYKKVVKADALDFRRIEANEAPAFAKTLVDLNRHRISAKGEVSSLEDERFRSFMADAVPYMAEQNIAWMDVIEKDGVVIGAALNFAHGKTVYYYMGGFAHDASEHRPGTALFALVIQRSIAEGFEAYDFLRGKESYKYRWAAQDELLEKIDIFPKSGFKGKAAWIAEGAETSLRKLLRRLRNN